MQSKQMQTSRIQERVSFIHIVSLFPTPTRQHPSADNRLLPRPASFHENYKKGAVISPYTLLVHLLLYELARMSNSFLHLVTSTVRVLGSLVEPGNFARIIFAFTVVCDCNVIFISRRDVAECFYTYYGATSPPILQRLPFFCPCPKHDYIGNRILTILVFTCWEASCKRDPRCLFQGFTFAPNYYAEIGASSRYDGRRYGFHQPSNYESAPKHNAPCSCKSPKHFPSLGPNLIFNFRLNDFQQSSKSFSDRIRSKCFDACELPRSADFFFFPTDFSTTTNNCIRKIPKLHGNLVPRVGENC